MVLRARSGGVVGRSSWAACLTRRQASRAAKGAPRPGPGRSRKARDVPAVDGEGDPQRRSWRRADEPEDRGRDLGRSADGVSWTVRTGASTDERYATERFVATLRMLQADSSTYPDFPLGSSARTYGMTGAGGSMGFADPDLQLGYG